MVGCMRLGENGFGSERTIVYGGRGIEGGWIVWDMVPLSLSQEGARGDFILEKEGSLRLFAIWLEHGLIWELDGADHVYCTSLLDPSQGRKPEGEVILFYACYCSG